MLVHCVVLPLLLISGPTFLVYMVLHCYGEKQATLQQIVLHVMQIEDEIEVSEGNQNDTVAIDEVLKEKKDNITKEERNAYHGRDDPSLDDCEIYLVPVLFFAFLCLFVLLMFLRYRLCA